MHLITLADQKRTAMHTLTERTYLTLDGRATTNEAEANELLGNAGDEIPDHQAIAAGLIEGSRPSPLHVLAERTYLRQDGTATTDPNEGNSLLGNEGDEIPMESALALGLATEPTHAATRAELHAQAVAAGLEPKKSARKADLVEMLEADAHERAQLLEQATAAEVDVDENATTAETRAALEAAGGDNQ